MIDTAGISKRSFLGSRFPDYEPVFLGLPEIGSILSKKIARKIDNHVVYADAEGKTVEAPGLSKGQKVRVHFRKSGGDNLADKITIIKN